jgi:hypothetical protein
MSNLHRSLHAHRNCNYKTESVLKWNWDWLVTKFQATFLVEWTFSGLFQLNKLLFLSVCFSLVFYFVRVPVLVMCFCSGNKFNYWEKDTIFVNLCKTREKLESSKLAEKWVFCCFLFSDWSFLRRTHRNLGFSRSILSTFIVCCGNSRQILLYNLSANKKETVSALLSEKTN